MKYLMKIVVILSLTFIAVNISYADSKTIHSEILGTWAITNETADSTYAGTTGHVTFYDDYMIIDSGRFAAAGLASAHEDVFCFIPLDPISYKYIGKSIIYVSWQGESRSTGDVFPQDAMITIVKHKGHRLTLIGEGGCGATGTPRISYLERIE